LPPVRHSSGCQQDSKEAFGEPKPQRNSLSCFLLSRSPSLSQKKEGAKRRDEEKKGKKKRREERRRRRETEEKKYEKKRE